MLVDLHIHTKASDGLYTAEEVCSMAIQAGLKGIAITDHDTLEGVLALKLDAFSGLEVIPGVEISTSWHGQDVHILGYNIAYDKGFLREKLSSFQKERKRRLTKMIKKLRTLGYEINESDIEAFAEGKSIGRPHVAQALIAKGYFNDVKTVFDKLLQAGAPAYVPREKTSPKEGIEAILSSGGVPVLAHPGLSADSVDLIGELVPHGLIGVEVYYPLHSPEYISVLLKITETFGLLATGGSDFHGFPGDYLGKSSVDAGIIDALKEASRSISRCFIHK